MTSRLSSVSSSPLMLKPWNRDLRKLDPFQISIKYVSPIHVGSFRSCVLGEPYGAPNTHGRNEPTCIGDTYFMEI